MTRRYLNRFNSSELFFMVLVGLCLYAAILFFRGSSVFGLLIQRAKGTDENKTCRSETNCGVKEH